MMHIGIGGFQKQGIQMNTPSRVEQVLKRLAETEGRLAAIEARLVGLEKSLGVSSVPTAEETLHTDLPAPIQAVGQVQTPVGEEDLFGAEPVAPSVEEISPPVIAVSAAEGREVQPLSQAPEPVHGAPSQAISTPEVSLPIIPIRSQPQEPPLQVWLRKINMLPPSGAEAIEASLVIWWAARLGTLMAVICAVFFAVYVSQHTPPWIKFCELVGTAFGVTLLGLWLERGYKQLGAVLFGGGLALIFFASFASYVVAPVKVIEDVQLAALVQFAAVLLLILCALWKKTQVIGSMAVLFGYVACLFSFVERLDVFALVFSLLLGVAAVWFFLSKGWAVPLRISIPFAYLIHTLVWSFGNKDKEYGWISFVTCNLAFLTIFGAADYVGLIRGRLLGHFSRKFFMIMNTSAAVGLGYLITRFIFREPLEHFYFFTGGLLLLASVLYYLRSVTDFMMHTYFIKGSTLISLGLIAAFGGYTRWVALAIQSFVFLLSAKKTRLLVLHLAVVLTWLASLGFFAHSLHSDGLFNEPASIWSRHGGFCLGYFLFSAVLLSLQSKWLGSKTPDTSNTSKNDPQRDLDAPLAVLAGLVGVAIAVAFFQEPHRPLAGCWLAVAAVLVGLGVRHWIPFAVAGLPLVFAHWRLWMLGNQPENILWTNALVVVLLTLGASVGLSLFGEKTQRKFRLCEQLLHALWLVSLQATFFKTMNLHEYFLACSMISVAALALSLLPALASLTDVSFLPMLCSLGALGMTMARQTVMAPTRTPSAQWALWLATFLAFGFACADVWFKRLRDNRVALRDGDGYQVLNILLAMGIGWYCLQGAFSGENLILALGFASVAVALLSHYPGVRSALLLSDIYLLSAHVGFYWLLTDTSLQLAPNSFLWNSIVLAALTLALPLLAKRLRADFPDDADKGLQWLHGTIALSLAYALFVSRTGALQNYITVLWGISAITIILIGLADRKRPFRIVGLVGLLVCVPRVFVVDMNSTLYRIAAFGALGLVTLGVAFLYSKYKHLIE